MKPSFLFKTGGISEFEGVGAAVVVVIAPG